MLSEMAFGSSLRKHGTQISQALYRTVRKFTTQGSASVLSYSKENADAMTGQDMLRLLVPAAGLVGFYLLMRRRRGPKVLEIPRLSADASPDEVAQALRARGVVVIERLIPEALMDSMLEELAFVKGVFHGAVGSFAGHQTLRNACKPLGESKVAQQLAVQPLVVSAVENLLRPWCKRVVLGTCSAISVEAPPKGEPPAPPQVLHRDGSMWGASTWLMSSRPELSVSVMWAASDFTAQNGATRFLPGSNHWEHSSAGYGTQVGPSVPSGISLDDVQQAIMPKGSVALWSGNTLHGAGSHAEHVPAEARSTRHGLLFIYNLGWLRSEHNFHWAIPREILQSFPQALKSLIGLDGENAVAHDWYTGPVYAQPYLGASQGTTSGDGIHLKTTTP